MLFSQACSTIADLSVSPRLVVAWCSLRRVSRLLLVSPMYASPQLQDILGLAAACVGSHWFSGPYSGGVLLSGFSPLLLWFWLGGTGKRPSLFSHVLDGVRRKSTHTDRYLQYTPENQWLPVTPSFRCRMLYSQERNQTSLYQSWVVMHIFTCFIAHACVYIGQIGIIGKFAR